MKKKIIIAGAGGQGIMLLGKVLAEAAMREDKHVTWLPSYGAEVRGGTAYCMVVISDAEIGSPYIDKADTAVIMNAPSLERFKSRIEKKGLLILNSSLIPAVEKSSNAGIFRYPFTDIAATIGNIKVANMVALGCLTAHTGILSPKIILEVICAMAPADKKHLIEINKKALEEGMKLK
ncbi:MAG: 2-oxoacid:acceptor oxidoreductase family protein [Candidatus Omnitrophica bacterium]|nr:2-oxoacid:acceptor oxidoreductase family protein [Candidatus Omnitrophota bacterium]